MSIITKIKTNSDQKLQKQRRFLTQTGVKVTKASRPIIYNKTILSYKPIQAKDFNISSKFYSNKTLFFHSETHSINNIST